MKVGTNTWKTAFFTKIFFHKKQQQNAKYKHTKNDYDFKNQNWERFVNQWIYAKNFQSRKYENKTVKKN